MLRPFNKCPGCGHNSTGAECLFTTIVLGDTRPVLKCSKCGLVYKDAAFTPEGLNRIYSTDYVHFQPNAAMTWADVNSFKQKLDSCQKLLGGVLPEQVRLIDVGCGGGNFVEIARRLGYDAEGIDPFLPEGNQSPYLRRGSPGDLDPYSYDVVVLLNVAEHLIEPRDMFTEIRRILKPGGVFLLTCPFGDSIARRIHKERWTHLALEEHLLFWTPGALRHVLRDVGFLGRHSFRIAGSPFPYGRLSMVPDPVKDEYDNEGLNDTSSIRNFTWQRYAWQIARSIQGREAPANLVRRLIHLTRSGDYLEFAIRAS